MFPTFKLFLSSICLSDEKSSTHSFTIKTFNKLGMEGTFRDIIEYLWKTQ
jgi:hypothetical protein